ncbi:MAG: TfoX/Sxy family protein [Methylobacterium frigidaeris]
MASQQSTVDFILEQATAAAPSARRMFGEYAIRCQGRTVALVCDDRLYLKPTPAGRGLLASVVEAHPFPGAKPWLLVEGDLWDDGESLAALFRATAASLPAPAPRKPRRKRPGPP